MPGGLDEKSGPMIKCKLASVGYKAHPNPQNLLSKAANALGLLDQTHHFEPMEELNAKEIVNVIKWFNSDTSIMQWLGDDANRNDMRMTDE